MHTQTHSLSRTLIHTDTHGRVARALGLPLRSFSLCAWKYAMNFFFFRRLRCCCCRCCCCCSCACCYACCLLVPVYSAVLCNYLLISIFHYSQFTICYCFYLCCDCFFSVRFILPQLLRCHVNSLIWATFLVASVCVRVLALFVLFLKFFHNFASLVRARNCALCAGQPLQLFAEFHHRSQRTDGFKKPK